MNKSIEVYFLVLVLLLSAIVRAENDPNTTVDPNVIRISAVALKNFGDSKASDSNRLDFIAQRITEQAIHGVCAITQKTAPPSNLLCHKSF